MKLLSLTAAAALLLSAAPASAFEPVPVVRVAACSEAISNGAQIELQNAVAIRQKGYQDQLDAAPSRYHRDTLARLLQFELRQSVSGETEKLNQYALKRWGCQPALITPSYYLF